MIHKQNGRDNGRGQFYVGKMYPDDPDAKLVTMGADITGDGQPALLVSQWTGGAHCCLSFDIFEIGAKFRKLAAIDEENSDAGPHFVQLERGSGLQVLVYDWTFAYWKGSFADSPAPKVVLRYRDGKYRVAPDLMQKPAPTTADMMVQARQVNQTNTDQPYPPGALWARMLDLIYTGHANLAWQFLDIAWSPPAKGEQRFPSKKVFVREFRAPTSQEPVLARGQGDEFQVTVPSDGF